MTIRAWGMPLPNIGSMDGNTGRSEGATAEKAVPFPCAVLDLNCARVEPRVRLDRNGTASSDQELASRKTSRGIVMRHIAITMLATTALRGLLRMRLRLRSMHRRHSVGPDFILAATLARPGLTAT